jgi:hypothetical protein
MEPTLGYKFQGFQGPKGWILEAALLFIPACRQAGSFFRMRMARPLKYKIYECVDLQYKVTYNKEIIKEVNQIGVS